MDDLTDPFNRRPADPFKDFFDKAVAASFPLPPAYKFVPGELAHMEIKRIDTRELSDLNSGCERQEFAGRVIFLPKEQEILHQEILMTHIADRLTNPKNVTPAQELKKNTRYTISPPELASGGWFRYTVGHKTNHHFPFAIFMCLEKERDALQKAITGAVCDLETTVDNLEARRSAVLMRPKPKDIQP